MNKQLGTLNQNRLKFQGIFHKGFVSRRYHGSRFGVYTVVAAVGSIHDYYVDPNLNRKGQLGVHIDSSI